LRDEEFLKRVQREERENKEDGSLMRNTLKHCHGRCSMKEQKRGLFVR